MGGKNDRRTDRISISLPVEVTGLDHSQQPFAETATTVVVNRHGAMILLARSLEPEQAITLRRTHPDGSRREAPAQVVGRVEAGAGKCAYGVAFRDPNIDFWGILFPAAEKAADAGVRLLVECSHCHSQELALLDRRELKEFELNRLFARVCPTCASPTIWKQPLESLRSSSAATRQAQNGVLPSDSPERETARYDTRLTACVRQGNKEELAVCENVSREGLAFRCRNMFSDGSQIEVSVPYTPGTANVFVPATVVHVRPLPAAGLYRHGVKYLRKKSESV